MTKISVVTVSCDSQATLEHCIHSVSAQRVDKEHVLVDGDSGDDTRKIIERYRGKFSTIICEPDNGIYDAMNKGIQAAKGDVVGFLNADDFYPDTGVLEQVVEAFDDPEVEACYGDLVYVKKDDISKTVRYWKSGPYHPKKFYHGWMPPHPTFFARRSVYEKYGLFNLALGSAADYEMMLRLLLKQGIHAAYIPETLVHMRSGGISNATVGNRLKANRMDRKAWAVNGLRPYPWTLWAKPIRKLRQWVIRN
jgi:glycosyltransferase involved in cell wall biosynthesis